MSKRRWPEPIVRKLEHVYGDWLRPHAGLSSDGDWEEGHPIVIVHEDEYAAMLGVVRDRIPDWPELPKWLK